MAQRGPNNGQHDLTWTLYGPIWKQLRSWKQGPARGCGLTVRSGQTLKGNPGLQGAIPFLKRQKNIPDTENDLCKL